MTSKNRGEIKSLFITQVRPFKPASKDTIARWIRGTVKSRYRYKYIFTAFHQECCK